MRRLRRYVELDVCDNGRFEIFTEAKRKSTRWDRSGGCKRHSWNKFFNPSPSQKEKFLLQKVDAFPHTPRLGREMAN
jgi:hypothetical protein